MDSQHRHELQHNEFEKLLFKLNGFLEKHGNRISIGICVLTAAIVGSILWFRSSKAQENAAWSLLNSASGPDDLVEVWDRHPGSSAANWARLLEAEQRLTQGIQAMFLDSEAGRGDLEKASKAFQSLSEKSGVPDELRERALFGLARSLESLSDGKVSDATAAYQRLLKAFPSSIFAADAKRRLAALAEGGTSDFYQWFASFDRPKPKDQKPRDTGTLDDELDDDLLRRVLQNSTGGALPAEGEATEGSSETDPADDAGTGSLTPPAPADEAPADSATLPDVQSDDSTGSGDQSNTTPPEGAADDAAVPVEESPPESP